MSTMNEFEDFEGAVSELVERALVDRGLVSHGLTPVRRDIVRSGHTDTYQSEITVDLFAGNNLVDVVEFSVFRAGRPVASIEELADWLNATLDGVIRRQEDGASPT